MDLSTLTHLECSGCHARHAADVLVNTCPACGRPLFARYDLEAAKERLDPRELGARSGSLWRYAELLPVRSEDHVVTLGEGGTPLLHLSRLGDELGLRGLLLKDEGRNPTGTFKARGLAVAVSRAKELGAKRLALPTAGNAGGALAAYAAAAGLEALVYAPRTTPRANLVEATVAGARLVLVDGTISDAGRRAEAERAATGAFLLSTMREPYRAEGKKTMGFEVAEALHWTLPDVIVCPTGGGTGVIALWKGFAELEALGLIGSRRPRLVAVQAEGCAPVVRAFEARARSCEAAVHPHTVAAGLLVPKPFADALVLDALYESHGTAVAVSDAAIVQAAKDLSAREGVFPAPEGAAGLAGLRQLLAAGWVDRKETVVLLNTGSGLKYVDVYGADGRATGTPP